MSQAGKWKLGTLAGEGCGVMETMEDGQVLTGPTAGCPAGRDGARGARASFQEKMKIWILHEILGFRKLLASISSERKNKLSVG